MLSTRIRIIIAVGLVCAFFYVINSVVKRKMDVKYALPWFFMLTGLALFDIFPFMIMIITRIVGIDAPANMLFFFGFCFSLVIIFLLTCKIYNVSIRLRRVAQDLALLKREIEDKNRD